MRKLTCILLFIVSAFALKAQDPRDSITGCYYCSLSRYVNNIFNSSYPSDTICIVNNDTVSNYVNIYLFSYAGSVEYYDTCIAVVSNDPSFYGYTCISSGLIKWNDSLYFSTYGASFLEMRYKCSRINSISIKDLDRSNIDFFISPQPATNNLYVQNFHLKFNQEDVPLIYVINGKQVNVPIQFINATTYKINVSSLNAGMYVISIKTNEGVVRKKIVIGN